jgi:Spy/CpxP family protein refolding chaperone
MHRIAGLTVALLALVVGVGLLTAEEAKETKHHHRVDALAAKLGLNDEQKEKIQKIHTEFDAKEDPVEHQLWKLHREERDAMSKVLTDEQRAKVPDAIKAEWHSMWEKVDAKLGLSAEQKEKIDKIRDEYGPKFRALAEAKGEKHHDGFRKLRHEEFAAIGKELTDEQRAKLPGIAREEFHMWRNPAARHEHMAAFAEKLGLSDEQKEKVKKVQEEYAPQVKKAAEELHRLHKEEHKEMEAVLTEDQRTKLQELRKTHGLHLGGTE